jgi:hypothetical protein
VRTLSASGAVVAVRGDYDRRRTSVRLPIVDVADQLETLFGQQPDRDWRFGTDELLRAVAPVWRDWIDQWGRQLNDGTQFWWAASMRVLDEAMRLLVEANRVREESGKHSRRFAVLS